MSWFGVRRRSEMGGSGHQYLGLPVEYIVAFIATRRTTGQRWISRQPCCSYANSSNSNLVPVRLLWGMTPDPILTYRLKWYS